MHSSIYPSTYPSIHLSIHLFTYLSIYSSIYPLMICFYSYSKKRVDYLTHLLLDADSGVGVHHECDRWGFVSYISEWLDREKKHLRSLSSSVTSMLRKEAVNHGVISGDDQRQGRERGSVLQQVFINLLFTAVVVGTALHAALRITMDLQLFNLLRSAFEAVVIQHNDSHELWVYGVFAALVKTLLVYPSNLVLTLIQGGVYHSNHTYRAHTLCSLYNDCLQWMQWDASTALAVIWLLSPIAIWMLHVQSVTLIHTSYSEIVRLARRSINIPSILLISNPLSDSSSQPTHNRYSSAIDTGSITASPDATAGITIKGLDASINGRPALKVSNNLL